MNVIMKNLSARNSVVHCLAHRQDFFGIDQFDTPPGEATGCIANDRVNGHVTAKLQRIAVTGECEMLGGAREIPGDEVTTGQPKLEIGKVIIQRRVVQVML